MIGEKTQGNEGNEGNFRNWMRGMRGEWEENLRNRMRETDWEGNEKPNEMGRRWEWEWNETEWEEKPNDDGNDRGMKPNEMMSLISYGRELEIGEREQRKWWGFFFYKAKV